VWKSWYLLCSFVHCYFLALVSQYSQYPVPYDTQCVCFPSLLNSSGIWSPVSHCGGLCAIRGRPCDVCGGQTGTGTGFCLSTSVSHITLMHSCVWQTVIEAEILTDNTSSYSTNKELCPSCNNFRTCISNRWSNKISSFNHFCF